MKLAYHFLPGRHNGSINQTETLPNSGKAFVWIDRYGAAFFTTWRDEENHYPEAVRNLRRRQSAPSQTKTPNTAAAPANRASHISAPPS